MGTEFRPLQILPSVPVLGAIDKGRHRLGPDGLFTGSVYAGWQGSSVVGDGTAGGDIYGGIISYFPTAVWNFNLSVDRVTNVTNIVGADAGGGLGGLPFAGIGIPLNESVHITAITLKSNYIFSPQTSVFGVISNNRIEFIDSPTVQNSWFATVGIQHSLSSNLTITGNFSYTNFSSPQPLTSFINYVATVGAIYNF